MKILFLSRDRGGRSQMAEGLARQMFGSEITTQSACVDETSKTHPLAVASMREVNIDITDLPVKAIGEVDPAGLDLVIVINERDVSDQLPRTIKRLHWPIMDPADPPAPEQELKRRFLDVRMALSKHLKGLGKLKKKL
jgi:arsenate reductase